MNKITPATATNKPNLRIVPLPRDDEPTPKEQVLTFLLALYDQIETGERPATSLIVVAIEQTEFTDKIYALCSGGLNRTEIIGHLFSTATEITMERDQ